VDRSGVLRFPNMVAVAGAGRFLIRGRGNVAVGIGLGVGAGDPAAQYSPRALSNVLDAGHVCGAQMINPAEVLSMVYYCDLGTGAWVGYFSGSGLTDCEWLIPGSGGE
jgi:hypothetical protein